MEKDIIKQLEETLHNFQNELQIKMDDFINRLNSINFSNLGEKIISKPTDNGFKTSELDIFDFSKLKITKAQLLKKIREILERAQHKIMLTVPIITDLEDLEVYNVRAGVNMNITCFIDIGLDNHEELLEEHESLRNIDIRNFEGKDRWVIYRDGEELLFIAIGAEKSNYLVFHTRDSAHVKLFSSLATDAWLRSKRI